MGLWDTVVNKGKAKTSLWDSVKPKPAAGPTKGTYTFPKPDNRAETSSGYMDPKWQNPTAQFDPTTYNIKQNPSSPVAPSNAQGTGGGGSNLLPAAAAVNPLLSLPDPRNDLNPAYDAAAKRIADLNAGLTGDFDAAIEAIKKNYLGSDKDIYDQYQNSRQQLDASATGLGVNPQEIYKGYDQDLRRVEENSNLQQNASLDFFNKLKVLRGQQFTDMQASLEQQRAKAIADQTAEWVRLMAEMNANAQAGKSGGSGGGGGGGGSGSNGISEKATQTQTVDDPEFMAQYLALRSYDPEAAAAAMEFYLGSQSSPSVKAATDAIGQTSLDLKTNKYSALDDYNNMEAILRRNPYVAAPGAADKEKERKAKNKENAKKLATQQRARKVLIAGASGSLGNAKTNNKITITGK